MFIPALTYVVLLIGLSLSEASLLCRRVPFYDTWCRQWGVVGMRSCATASDMCGALLGKTKHPRVNKAHQSMLYIYSQMAANGTVT